MKIALSILDAVLIFLSFGAVGSQLDPAMPKLLVGEGERYLSAAFFAGGFVYLHWSLWRLLVPREIVGDRCARFFHSYDRGFFGGTVGYGYGAVFGFYIQALLPVPHPERELPQSVFWFGVVLIVIGVAARGRAVILHLATKDSGPAPLSDSDPQLSHGSDTPVIRAST